MPILEELFTIVRSSSAIMNRVAAASWKGAKLVFTEASSTPNHAIRIRWAKRLLQDAGDGPVMKEMTRMVLIVLQKPDPTDEEIETAVGQIIDKVAEAEA